jgi:hypothetical protein
VLIKPSLVDAPPFSKQPQTPLGVASDRWQLFAPTRVQKCVDLLQLGFTALSPLDHREHQIRMQTNTSKHATHSRLVSEPHTPILNALHWSNLR